MGFPTADQEAESARLRAALRARAADFPASLIKRLIRGKLAECLAGASPASDETTLWVADRAVGSLVPIHHRGPDPERFLCEVSQPLDSGIISMIFAGGASICENEIETNPDHSPIVDSITGRQTIALLVAPVPVAGRVIAVLSGVKIQNSGSDEPRAYSLADLSSLQSASKIAGNLLEDTLLATPDSWIDA
jgi:hypothetical protein